MTADTLYAIAFTAAFFAVMIGLPILTTFSHWRIRKRYEKKRQEESERIRKILEGNE